MTGPQGASYPTRFIREDSFPVDPILNNLNPSNPSFPYTSLMRLRLTMATTYFVSTMGNDTTGNGTVGAPWRTRQKAADYILQNVDIGGQIVTVQSADGNYTDGVIVNGPWDGGGPANVVFVGNLTTPANVDINASAGPFQAINGGGFTVRGCRARSSSNHALTASDGGRIIFDTVDFGPMAGGLGHQYSTRGGHVRAQGNYSISGGAFGHHLTDGQAGQSVVSGTIVTLTGTPAFNFFARQSVFSFLQAYGVTYVGAASASTTRFSVSENSVIQTNSASPINTPNSYFPGVLAGQIASGGIYQ